MSQLKPADQTPPGANPSAAPVVEPGFEVALHEFWQKKQNRNWVLAVCAAVLLGIIGWKGLEFFADQQEKGMQAEYASVADQPAKLATFAEAHSGHVLAGVAWLQLADDKYSAGDFAAAAANYQKAATSLKNEALLGRAKLGAAISQVGSGNQAAGEAALKALGADATLLKSVRAEALYHLASLALEAGKSDEVRSLADQISRIDTAGPWSQRATILLAGLPPIAGKPADGSAPTVSFKPGK